jgi:hypothetical protein
VLSKLDAEAETYFRPLITDLNAHGLDDQHIHTKRLTSLENIASSDKAYYHKTGNAESMNSADLGINGCHSRSEPGL